MLFGFQHFRFHQYADLLCSVGVTQLWKGERRGELETSILFCIHGCFTPVVPVVCANWYAPCVVPLQVYCILSAIRERKKSFVFTDGSVTSLDPRVGFFITMVRVPLSIQLVTIPATHALVTSLSPNSKLLSSWPCRQTILLPGLCQYRVLAYLGLCSTLSPAPHLTPCALSRTPATLAARSCLRTSKRSSAV